MWTGGREFLPTYGCLLVTLTGLHRVHGSDCESQNEYLADNTIRTLTSPHGQYSSVKSCKWNITSSIPEKKIYLRVYFPKLVTSFRDCTKTFVDVFDGPEVNSTILGRWCDMNSTLMTSSGPHVVIYSASDGVSFNFQVFYCLDPFTRPDISWSSPRQLTQLEIAGIAIGTFLAILIFSCVTHKYCNPCKNGQSRTRNNDTNDSPFVVTFSRENQGATISRFSQDPPDYWTAVRSGSVDDRQPESSNQQPPSYSEAMQQSDITVDW